MPRRFRYVQIFLKNLAFRINGKKTQHKHIQTATCLVSMCECVLCVFFPFILDIKFVGRTSRGHTGGGHTGFLIHLLSAVRALIFLARRIQPFLSLVDREVEFCVLPGNDLIVLHPLGIFILVFYILVRKIPFAGIKLTSQRVRRLHGYL